jgi:hypothetical protein
MSELIQTCGEIPKPTHYPMMSMGQYGKIPGKDEPLFRIVFAPTVYGLVGGEHTEPDTGAVWFTGYLSLPRYGYIGDKWIMEMWIPANVRTGGLSEPEYRAKWEDPNTHLILTGPYPFNGDWQWVWTFNKPEQIGAAGIVAALVNKAKFNSQAANRAAIEQATEKAKQDKFQQNFDKMHDSQRVSGIRAANIGGRVKAQKSFRDLQDARSLGLPTRGARTIKPTSGQLQVAGF